MAWPPFSTAHSEWVSPPTLELANRAVNKAESTLGTERVKLKVSHLSISLRFCDTVSDPELPPAHAV